MAIIQRITGAVNRLTKRLSYNSNNPTKFTNTYGNGRYEEQFRTHHGGKLSYKEYQKILEDTQVGIAVDTLISFLLSKDYVLTSNSDEEIDVEIRDFIQDTLDNMETPFRKVRKDAYTSIKYGWAALERVYTTNQNNKITLQGLYGIHMKTLQNDPFVKDDNGELIAIHQQSVNGSVDIPIEKIMLCRYNNEFDELEGNSILNRVKEYPELKDKIITWLMVFLHKHENPVTYAKLAGNSQFKNDVLRMLDEVAEGRTSMTIGKDDELGTLESSHRGEAFFTALNYFDNLIFRALFLGNLLLGDGGQTGSYAQSNTQLKVAGSIFDGIHTDIAYDIQQVIDYLVEINYGVNAKSPSFSFEKFTETDIIGLLNALQPYATSMLIDTDTPWFQELISKVVMELADVKVDIDNVTPADEPVNYDMQEPIPGQTEAEQIINESLEGII